MKQFELTWLERSDDGKWVRQSGVGIVPDKKTKWARGTWEYKASTLVNVEEKNVAAVDKPKSVEVISYRHIFEVADGSNQPVYVGTVTFKSIRTKYLCIGGPLNGTFQANPSGYRAVNNSSRQCRTDKFPKCFYVYESDVKQYFGTK